MTQQFSLNFIILITGFDKGNIACGKESDVAPRPIDTIKITLDLKKHACHVLEKKSSFAITIIDFLGLLVFID